MPATPKVVEHWILNLVIEGERKLSDFLPFVESLYLNVQEVPDCSAEEYAEGVLALFDAGLVRMYFDIGEDEEFDPDRALVEAIVRRRLQLPRVGRVPLTKARRLPREIRPAEPDLMMKLTASGGRAWEALAEPDWSRYVQTLTGDESGEAWSGNRDMLIAELGWYEELTSATIDRNTIRLEALHDYPVTYWKLLPVVFRASFACTWSERMWGGKRYPGEPKWFREWWESRSDWYKQPWELPNWPRPL